MVETSHGNGRWQGGGGKGHLCIDDEYQKFRALDQTADMCH